MSRRLAVSVAAVFLLLAATAEERTFGTVSDEQQMLYTAISIATTGEIGISRNQHFSIPRPGGDALAPYGMGLPLVEVPFAAVAGPWEARFGVRTSQTLFVLLEVLLVTAAAAAAGLLAAELGAGAFGQGLAVFGTGLGSPLWAYTAYGFSEPLQAACLVFALLFAVRAARSGGRAALGRAALAGFYAGWLVLTKAVNLAFVPFALLPLLFGAWPPTRERLRAWAAAAAGAAGPLAAMLAFELVRFGRPFSSYGDQRFAHPFLDGAWRLLVGVNKGLFVYFPLACLAAAALVLLARAPKTRGTAWTIAGLSAAFLAVYARWWAWDGSGGWGPRFLVPLVPVLAAAAGTATRTRAGRTAGAALLALGIGVNALGTFESEAATFFYVSSTGLARVSPELYAEYPASFRPPRGENGVYRLWRYVVAASDPEFSALRVHPFLLRCRAQDLGDDERRERLRNPPWLAARPDAIPDVPQPSPMITTRTPLVNYLTTPFRWPHLFMSFTHPRGERPGTYNPVWYAGMADEALRSLDIGKPERAARIAATLFDLLPSGYMAAIRLEGLRLSGGEQAAAVFAGDLPDRVLHSPAVLLVQALRARDRGEDVLASTLLSEAARGIRTRPMRDALGRPPAQWPHSFRELSSEITDGTDANVSAPPR